MDSINLTCVNRWLSGRILSTFFSRSRIATIILAYVFVLSPTFVFLVPYLGGLYWKTSILLGFLYLFSHLLRSVRLAVLASDLLGVSGRTTAAMHFSTAPFSLIFPYKLGEVMRLYCLWKMSGDFIRAFTVILVERMYDSLFLLPLICVVLMQGHVAVFLAVFTLMAAIIPLIIVVLGPRLLSETQRYIVVNHGHSSALKILQGVDSIRRVVVQASQISRRQVAELCIISLMIWCCEVLFCLVLVYSLSGAASEAWNFLGLRLSSSWSNVASIEPAVLTALVITSLSLLLPWPALSVILMSRWRKEPRHTPSLERARRGVNK